MSADVTVVDASSVPELVHKPTAKLRADGRVSEGPAKIPSAVTFPAVVTVKANPSISPAPLYDEKGPDGSMAGTAAETESVHAAKMRTAISKSSMKRIRQSRRE